jgi:predicted nucleic acid-binding protein
MAVYALDTNIIIHYLYNHTGVIQNLEQAIKDKHDLIIPHIVDYEIRRGFEIQSAPKKESSYNMLAQGQHFCRVVDMGDYYWPTAARVYAGLYRKHLTVGDLDILIAAYCIHNNYTLVSDNTKHFENIDGLNLTNWI